MSAYADRFEALYSNFLLGYKEVSGDPQLTTKILNTVQEIEPVVVGIINTSSILHQY